VPIPGRLTVEKHATGIGEAEQSEPPRHPQLRRSERHAKLRRTEEGRIPGKAAFRVSPDRALASDAGGFEIGVAPPDPESADSERERWAPPGERGDITGRGGMHLLVAGLGVPRARDEAGAELE
jgi:hypothetical protein